MAILKEEKDGVIGNENFRKNNCSNVCSYRYIVTLNCTFDMPKTRLRNYRRIYLNPL